MNGAVPWYQSRSVMGAIAAIIMTVATQFHLLPAAVTQDQVLSFLLMAVPMAVALEGRISATKQVVTTPAKAATINAAAEDAFSLSGAISVSNLWRDALDLAHYPHLPALTAPADPAKASPVISTEKPMSSIIVEIEDDVLTFLKSAGKAVETFALSESQKLVAEVKQTYVGTVAMNVIQALESQEMDTAEKFDAVVTAIVPLIQKLIASGGISGAVASVESFAREVAQSAYNDLKADIAKIAGNGTSQAQIAA